MDGRTDTDAVADAAALARYASDLADGIAAALGPWVVRSVVEVADRWRSGAGVDLVIPAEQAAGVAIEEVVPMVRDLLTADVDAQASSPLAVVRLAVRYPTQVLADAGVPTQPRDEFAERNFPEDVYGLAPASLADLDPELQRAGLVWGAAKAHVVMARRRAEGLR